MISLFSHARFRAPLYTLRSRVSGIWRAGFAAAGRYKPFSTRETMTVQGSDAPFKGDIPIGAGGERVQTRVQFAELRPPFEDVENLTVTPAGAGWKDGVLYEKYSSSKPGLRMLGASCRPVKTVALGFFVQSEHTDTFGDWVSEYLGPLARAGVIDAPLFLPAAMAAKPYIKRDAVRLGLNVVGVTAPLLIQKAKVIRQPKVIRYWLREDVSALRKFLKVDAPRPKPGSMVYLSRHGEASEVAVRTYPNLAVEEVVRARGGLVLRTGQTSLEDYIAAAPRAETVLLDHGSAGYNMIYWRPRRVIEFVSDAWWLSAFLFFADASGVHDYTIIRSDAAGMGAKLACALDLAIET